MLLSAQSAFEGTWKTVADTVQFPDKPDAYLLQNNTYQCKSCVPAIVVKADGADQKVEGDPYFDTLSVKAIDDRNVETTRKKDGRIVRTVNYSVSSDSNTLTVKWTDSGEPSGGTQNGTYMAKRVAEGPDGANMISGSWHIEKAQASAGVITWSYKVNGDQLTMTQPTGQSYTANLDGTDAPYRGDPGITSVSVRMLDKNTLEETDKRNDNVIEVSKMTLSGDGKTMKVVDENKLRHSTARFEAQKLAR